jgi:hypothetical protein
LKFVLLKGVLGNGEELLETYIIGEREWRIDITLPELTAWMMDIKEAAEKK